MTIYRTLTAMTIGGRRLRKGRVFKGNALSAASIAGLLKAGRITEVAAPPLEVLPGFEERAATIAEQYNVADADEFVELENLPDLFEEWQGEVLGALDAPKTGCTFCGR